MKKRLTSSQQFVQRLELLEVIDAELPADVAEAERALREAGVDPKALVERVRKHVQEVRAGLAGARLAQAAEARKAQAARMAEREKSFAGLTMEDLIERVRAIASSPEGQGLAVAHKGLTGRPSREDLEALLTEYAHLQSEKKNGSA